MQAPKLFVDIDFETRSEADIMSVGAYKYAEHPSTEVLMISFSINQKNIYNWNPFFSKEKNLKRLEHCIDKVVNGNHCFRAHNSEFEYWIWNLVAVRQFDWPKIPVEKFYDTMVQACVLGLPASLENAGTALELVDQKDKEGKALINFFSKPSRKKAEKYNCPLQNKIKFQKFIDYCDQDVRTQIGISRACPPMTDRQFSIFILTEKMNIRGLPIDHRMAEGALELVDVYKERADKQVQKITGGMIESATQNVALVKWLNENGCNIPNMQAPTVQQFVNSKKTNKVAKRLLRIRSNVSKTSTAKYKSALHLLSNTGKVHGFLKAFIAKTGRWGGRGLQIQNFSKPHKDFPWWCDYDILSECIAEVRLHLIETMYDDVMESLKAATRSMIKAPKGYKFICADYAQIEARIVMWLANDRTGLKDFSGEGKIYERMASEIFDVVISLILKPSFERDVGKETVLGCGFGMGWKKFLSRCVEQRGLDISAAIAQSAVKRYRNTYKKVPAAWKECEASAIKAIQNPGMSFSACEGKLVYKTAGPHLSVTLPSKRKLYYPHAYTRLEINEWGSEQEVIYYKGWNNKARVGHNWGSEKIWGGTLFQHAVQAIAMDVMSNGMLTAETRGYPTLFTVHDESLAMVKDSFGSVKEYEDILCELEPWAKGLPIIAEGWEGQRYKK